MKKIWKKPQLEMLDVSETMKFWPPKHGGGWKDRHPKPGLEDPFGS